MKRIYLFLLISFIFLLGLTSCQPDICRQETATVVRDGIITEAPGSGQRMCEVYADDQVQVLRCEGRYANVEAPCAYWFAWGWIEIGDLR